MEPGQEGLGPSDPSTPLIRSPSMRNDSPHHCPPFPEHSVIIHDGETRLPQHHDAGQSLPFSPTRSLSRLSATLLSPFFGGQSPSHPGIQHPAYVQITEERDVAYTFSPPSAGAAAFSPPPWSPVRDAPPPPQDFYRSPPSFPRPPSSLSPTIDRASHWINGSGLRHPYPSTPLHFQCRHPIQYQRNVFSRAVDVAASAPTSASAFSSVAPPSSPDWPIMMPPPRSDNNDDSGAAAAVSGNGAQPPRHRNSSSTGGGPFVPDDPATNSIRAHQQRVSLVAHWISMICCCTLLGLVLMTASPLTCPLNCNFLQSSWPLVWLLNRLAISAILVWATHLQSHGRQIPKSLTFMRRFLRLIFDPVWFGVGIYPLFYMPPCCREAVSVGRMLWWLQAALFLLGLFCLLTLCLCLPFVIYLIYRFGPRDPNRTPTPPHLMTKLERRKYGDLLNSLREEYGAHEIELATSTDRFTEALDRNPFIRAFADATTGMTGAGEAAQLVTRGSRDYSHNVASVQPPSGTTGVVRLKVEKACPICMMEFQNEDELICMPCDRRHFFHSECIVRWLETSSFCPICRANIANLLGTTSTATQTAGAVPSNTREGSRHEGEIRGSMATG